MGKILLVEDDQVFGTHVSDLLHRSGFKVSWVSTVREALGTLGSSDDIDGVVLDLLLPNGDGMEVLKAVEKSAASVPVVVVTALEREELEEIAIMFGAHDFLYKKNLNEEELVRALRHAVVRHRVRGEFKPLNGLLAKAEEKMAQADKLVESISP